MKKPELAEQVSEEFFLRVNDFIEMANRIERRLDSGHAQIAILHACSRYGAHHYRNTVKQDSEAERHAFALYLAEQFGKLTLQNIDQLAGPAPAADAAGDASAE